MADHEETGKLADLLRTGDERALAAFCSSAHPEEIAGALTDLDPAEIWAVLRHAEAELRAEIFSRLDGDTRLELADLLTRRELAQLLAVMAPDDRADLFRDMPEDRQISVLPALAQAEREDIRRLAAYKEGTAGAIMTSDYATLRADFNAGEALAHLRLEAPDRETIYYAYVVDAERKLLGFVSLKDLILARPAEQVGRIMNREVISARADEDQEIAARKLQKYDLLAMPVVDAQNTLVGIITYDDAFDVIIQEQTEDMEKIMAIAGDHEPGMYLRQSVWSHFRNRVLWVILLAFLGLISGMIVQRFEGLLLQFAILATFMPMLADTGGNTGSQSATLVVRALALQEIKPRDILRILFRELSVGIMLGGVLAIIAFGRVLLFSRSYGEEGGPTAGRIGLAVALALGLQVVTSTVIGALLPLTASRFKCDPALVASPALTTIVDITGLLIFFTTAKLMLGF